MLTVILKREGHQKVELPGYGVVSVLDEVTRSTYAYKVDDEDRAIESVMDFAEKGDFIHVIRDGKSRMMVVK